MDAKIDIDREILLESRLAQMHKMETIRLDALAARQFQLTPEEANGLIMAGRIYIGQVPADKPGLPVAADTILTLREKNRKYASRSGYKLEKALSVFSVCPRGRIVCDIGASNGGFTDCLLQHEAARIYAVDVAYGILAWELRTDERVVVLERTNARNLTADQLGQTCDLATADVSFISIKKIFPAINRILKENGQCICLIKPQFEALPKQLGKNGNMITPETDLPPLMHGIADAAEKNRLYMNGLTVSPIHGTNGNVEYLMFFTRHPSLTEQERQACILQAIHMLPDM